MLVGYANGQKMGITLTKYFVRSQTIDEDQTLTTVVPNSDELAFDPHVFERLNLIRLLA